MKPVYVFYLLAGSAVLIAVSVAMPEVLAENAFLKNFINHEVLGVMGVIMSISIASIATIHLWFNELERKYDSTVFGSARREINQAAYLLIALFVIQLVVLIVRSLTIFDGHQLVISLFNSLSILLLLASVLTLLDVVGVVRVLSSHSD